jgi:hypothetical protein
MIPKPMNELSSRGISGIGLIRIDIQPVMMINAKLERSSEKEVFCLWLYKGINSCNLDSNSIFF